MEEVSCCHCGGYFTPDPRQKNPRHCRKLECQRARKAAWQREKIRGDPDYRANQKRCWQDWRKEHPDYWKAYRQCRNILIRQVAIGISRECGT